MLSNLRFTVGQLFLQLKHKFYNAKQKEDYTGNYDGPRINPMTLENESLPPKRERDLLSTLSLLENDKAVLMEKLTSSQKEINELTEKLAKSRGYVNRLLETKQNIRDSGTFNEETNAPGKRPTIVSSVINDATDSPESAPINDLGEYTERYFGLCAEMYRVLNALVVNGRCGANDICEITSKGNEIVFLPVAELIEGVGSSPYSSDVPDPTKIISIGIKGTAGLISIKSQPLETDKEIEVAFYEKTLYHFRTNPQ